LEDGSAAAGNEQPASCQSGKGEVSEVEGAGREEEG